MIVDPNQIIVGADIMSMFSFCKFLPTYILTYVYSMSEDAYGFLLPGIEFIM